MKIGILGTGEVGRVHAAKLVGLGHEVMVGTRDVKRTLARNRPDEMGNPPFRDWQADHPSVKLGSFAQAARHGEIIINAVDGRAAVRVVLTVGRRPFADKILIDISNALAFREDDPPRPLVPGTDSVAERIQRALPRAKVVKTLNDVAADLQVDPGSLADGDHDAFLSGNDSAAKKKVEKILKDWYGWKTVIDLGDLRTARGAELLLVAWAELWQSLGTARFNFKVVK